MADFHLTPRQAEAWLVLQDDETTELGYGGAAGGGKSILGCFWILTQALKYPGTAYVIGRRELTNLKKTTLLSLYKVLEILKIKPDVIFSLNSQTNIIEFKNGSRIFLMDMSYNPSDPLYTRFGSLELTQGFIDESNENDIQGIEIIKTRLGRCKNQEYGILPKLLESFNPTKTHVYYRFYIPWRDGKLPKHRMFIKALATDNTYIDKNYIQQLERADDITRDRLLHGNFEYADDAASLVSYEKILKLFVNKDVPSGKKRITSDLAMQGRDLFIVGLWDGLRVSFPVVKEKCDGKEIEEDIRKIMTDNQIKPSDSIVDSDGLGNYLQGYIKGIYPFRGGARAIRPAEYANLKSECAFKLAELINNEKIYIDCNDIKLKERIIKELEVQLKRDKLDVDTTKKTLISKEDVKEQISISPDFFDVLNMRMIPELIGGNIVVFNDTKGVVF